jgi:hypothetical protein
LPTLVLIAVADHCRCLLALSTGPATTAFWLVSAFRRCRPSVARSARRSKETEKAAAVLIARRRPVAGHGCIQVWDAASENRDRRIVAAGILPANHR